MIPAAGNRRHRFASPPSPRLSLSSLRCLRIRFRLFVVLLFPSLYFVFLLSSTSSADRRSFLIDFLPVLAFSSGAVLLFSLLLPSLRLLPRPPSLPVLWSIGGSAFNLRADRRNGFAVQVYNNGDVYEGELRWGKCSGSGVYYYCKSGKYEGDWLDAKYDGCGVETWTKGSRYRGQYKKGLRHGFGVYRFYTGDVYAGEWLNGQSHGCGVHTCDDGSRYVGEFKWGIKHGLGHYRFRNGDTYAGEYFADKMHGFGVYRFANGQCYEGAWHEGRRQGLGMYTFANGETQSGHWFNGVLETSSTRNPFPGSSFAVNHSRVLNAVQEARTAAGKAFHVRRVDVRVNKAVTAANNAANAARTAASKAVQNEKGIHHDRREFPLPIV
ncbi:Phosphatidylinositol 4-phosphate 5-kinase 8 [Apostasia shenzhenica]|uniref:Phosphatidylinositol 4-phosphate 5-kinase 8 n=1 Tax=Apostasia shenzhenica TaxID=1088818 RepID=A0A2I0ACN0_9ASPA|nr:Phosphatidylinositol 4-phosphate 5-kinase 8 [Apostasia shenzhenica]